MHDIASTAYGAVELAFENSTFLAGRSARATQFFTEEAGRIGNSPPRGFFRTHSRESSFINATAKEP